jgi:hypothetical protein
VGYLKGFEGLKKGEGGIKRGIRTALKQSQCLENYRLHCDVEWGFVNFF